MMSRKTVFAIGCPMIIILLLAGCVTIQPPAKDSGQTKVTVTAPASQPSLPDMEKSTTVELAQESAFFDESSKTPAPSVPEAPSDQIKEETDNSEFELVNQVEVSKPVRFNLCSPPARFKNATWFADFEKAIVQFDRLSPSEAVSVGEANKISAEEMIKKMGKVKISDLIQICFSIEGHLALAMDGGGYCVKGGVWRFDTLKKMIDRAVFLDDVDNCSASFTGFGKRRENLIPVKAEWGDAGCFSETSYDYDFIKNTLKQTRLCSGCADAKTGKNKRECKENQPN